MVSLSTTRSPARTLVVMRHAKAEGGGPSDFERVLADRGHADAADAGAWLASQGVAADGALVSAARRTEETWEDVCAAAGWTGVEPDLRRSLYLADEDGVLEAIRTTRDAVTTLVVIGHNPTMHALAVWLDDGEGDAVAREAIVSGYPTSAACVFDVAVAWSELTPGTATVRGLHVGRGRRRH